jgi:hypothetical protein
VGLDHETPGIENPEDLVGVGVDPTLDVALEEGTGLTGVHTIRLCPGRHLEAG